MQRCVKTDDDDDDDDDNVHEEGKEHYLLFENWMYLIWKKLKSKITHGCLKCTKFGWNWPSGSGEGAF